MPQNYQFLMILTSERISRHSLVQILWHAIFKKCSKTLSFFHDFDFRIALSPQPGADFAEHNFKKCSKQSIFKDFDFRIALWPQPGADFAEHNFKKCSKTPSF